MSTPDFDAAVERAAEAMFEARKVKMGLDEFMELPWGRALDESPYAHVPEHFRLLARAALQASGWEEAAGIVSDLLECFDPQFVAKNDSGGGYYEACGECVICRAHAWVAQYTPEAK